MGELLERVKLSLLVYGNGIEENFKNNSAFMVDSYSKSSDMVKSMDVSKIQEGYFYFFHYLDSSNWMKYSPVFVVGHKKFGNQIIVFAINLNFIPLEVRPIIFDEYLTEKDLEEDLPIKTEYERTYNELKSIGFEYTLMEYNAIQIKMVHKINMHLLPRFLYSQHPMATYDPKKLIQIWNKKLETKEARDKEMMGAIIQDFYSIDKEISERYVVLKEHIKRLQKSVRKYGGK